MNAMMTVKIMKEKKNHFERNEYPVMLMNIYYLPLATATKIECLKPHYCDLSHQFYVFHFSNVTATFVGSFYLFIYWTGYNLVGSFFNHGTSHSKILKPSPMEIYY